MSCEYEMDVTAYLDGELGEDDVVRVRRHIEDCDSCGELHARLAKTREGLEELFRAELAGSPAAPTAVSLLACDPEDVDEDSWLHRFRFAAVAAVIFAIVGTVVFWPGGNVEASPAAEVVERAASRFDRFEDVELWIRAELAGGNPEKAQLLRLFVSKEHGVAAYEGDGSEGDGRALSGVMGEDAWEYDEERDAIVITPFESGKISSALGQGDPRSSEEKEEDPFGLTLLSFGMVSRLNDEMEQYDLDEVTGPFHRRIGRRCFRLTPKEAKEDRSFSFEDLIPTSITLTIDPTTDLVERIDYQIGLILVVLNISAEIAEVDQGLAPAMFDYRTHYGEDVEVIREKK